MDMPQRTPGQDGRPEWWLIPNSFIPLSWWFLVLSILFGLYQAAWEVAYVRRNGFETRHLVVDLIPWLFVVLVGVGLYRTNHMHQRD